MKQNHPFSSRPWRVRFFFSIGEIMFQYKIRSPVKGQSFNFHRPGVRTRIRTAEANFKVYLVSIGHYKRFCFANLWLLSKEQNNLTPCITANFIFKAFRAREDTFLLKKFKISEFQMNWRQEIGFQILFIQKNVIVLALNLLQH